jgi:hypothetical protein
MAAARTRRRHLAAHPTEAGGSEDSRSFWWAQACGSASLFVSSNEAILLNQTLDLDDHIIPALLMQSYDMIVFFYLEPGNDWPGLY